MPTRRGGFGGGNLDPFGGRAGGLGRYNVTGDSIQSLADAEAYATAVGWSNGVISDAVYLASLQHMVDLSNPGSRERVTAENKLGDAQYSIGRNQIALEVNGADTPAARTAALRKMLAYDQTRLTKMTPDNEAYRSQVDRVSGIRVDIRQSQYSDLVNKVNAGKATTQQLLTMARDFAAQAGTDPDVDDWHDTIGTLTDRVADENLADAFQAYQHNRMKGSVLLGKLDARMSGLTPGSPAYKELQRQREDLVQRLKTDDMTKRTATINGQRASGKVSDSKYLAYLRDEVNAADPGSNEKIDAENRLREFTFSIAEDKLRFDVQKGKRPVSALIAFYKGARAGMTPNSERYRAITLAIDSLARGGGIAGGRGGGGGKGKAGKGLAYFTKQLTGEATLHDILGTSKAPPGFADLFRLDLSNIASRRWWDNNLRSAVSAFQTGARTWTYYDKGGNAHALPFTPSMMSQFDKMNFDYTRQGLAGAKSVKDAQFWTGKLITATKAVQQRGGQYTMDVYTKSFGDLQRAKESALAGDRWAEYANLTKEQTELARFILGGTLDPNASTNPYLTADQKGRIGRDLDHIAPLNPDAGSDTYNPDGDLILQMMDDQRITLDVDADGNAVGGKLDPQAGYRTQRPDGTIALVPFDMNEAGNSVYDPQLDKEVPAYLSQTAPSVIRQNGQDIEVHQPIVDTGGLLPVFVSKTGPATGTPGTPFTGQQIPGKAVSVDPYAVAGQQVTLPLKAFNTYEGHTLVKWVSIDGKTWVRYIPGEGPPPRVVIGSDYSYDGKAWTKDGKAVDATAVLGSAHWWSLADGKAAGQAWGFGAPGRSYTTRTARDDGRIDTRPDWMFIQPRGGAQEFDTRDPSEIRGYYFDDGSATAKAKLAGAASVGNALDRQYEPPSRRPPDAVVPTVYGPGGSAYGRGFAASLGKQADDRIPNWSSDIIPVAARTVTSGLRAIAPATGRLISEDQRNMGYKAPPVPVLHQSASVSLAPVTVRPIGQAIGTALKAITLPTLAPKTKPMPSPTSAAAAAAAAASAEAKARAARDAKAARAAAAAASASTPTAARSDRNK